MKEYFSEYGWLCVTLIGGSIGLTLLFDLCVGQGSILGDVVSLILEGLMG